MFNDKNIPAKSNQNISNQQQFKEKKTLYQCIGRCLNAKTEVKPALASFIEQVYK